jgi:ABC-type nitrate/sulfonate/bicarbonate transport system substrate-binding protein
MKMIFLLFGLLLNCSLISHVCAADEPSIRIGWAPGTSPRFFVAHNQQTFQKAGLVPQFSKFITGPTMLAALKGEDIDVAFMTTPPAIFGLAQGLEIQVFFIESDAAGTQALVSTKQAAMKSFADQKAKTIGVTYGTSAHYALLKSLEDVKLTDADITILDMQPTAMLPAFINRNIDGAWSWDPWTAKMENEGGVLVGSLTTMRLPMPGVWVVRTKWLEGNKEAVQRFIKAMDIATGYMRTHEGEAVSALGKELGVDADLAQRIYRRIDVPDLSLQIEGYIAALGTTKTKQQSGMFTHMEDLGKFFFDLKRIPVNPNIAVAIDPEPLETYLKK